MEGHFILNSGLHSGHYVQKVSAGADPVARGELTEGMLETLRDCGISFDVVAASPMGALAFGTELSRQAGTPYAFLEKRATGEAIIRDVNANLVRGRRVVLVEDIITSGKNAESALKALNDAGAVVAALVCIVNRKEYRPDGIVFLPLATVTAGDDRFTTYEPNPESCPLCKQGVPISTNAGKGEKK